MKSYIKIEASRQSESGKTIIYNVWTDAGSTHTSGVSTVLLGEIRWYGAWRKYAFFPSQQTLFEEVCLREIAMFIENRTQAHRREKKKAASVKRPSPICLLGGS